MRPRGARIGTIVLLGLLLAVPSHALAYSILAHQAIIDAAWQDQIAPMLKQKFPRTSAEALREARAYAYGGSLIQDLGYYPFSSRFFSNLVHYVRSGDFVEALVRESRDVNEYAFALGALAHYASDNVGHPRAVNRAVSIVYPKVRAEHGAAALYADAPSRHVMVEFAFDVVHVARGTFKSDVYQDLIGFQVATPVLERAFRETYGLELEDVFGNVDMAIGTYRKTASEIIPDITRAAWREKRDEILAARPDITERDVVYSMTRRQYEGIHGTAYRKPGFFARVVVAIFTIVPKFGPFKPLAFEPLSADMERMFLESFTASGERYRALIQTLRAGRFALSDTDLDTGTRPTRGVNTLADETYADLVARLAGKGFASVPPGLRRSINEHYASDAGPHVQSRKVRKREQQAARHLAAMNAIQSR